jgi:hypothetical protein
MRTVSHLSHFLPHTSVEWFMTGRRSQTIYKYHFMCHFSSVNLTFRPVKKEQLLQKLPLLVVLLSCIVLVEVVTFQAIKDRENQRYYSVTSWSTETAKGFFDSCTYTTLRPGSGVTNGAAKVYCGCSIDALQVIYKNDNQLLQAEKDWVKTGYPPALISAMRECAKKANVPLIIDS